MNNQFIRSISINWNEISADSYLRDIAALKSVEELVFDHPVTYFVGENASGKSTLLEAIAVAYGFNPEGGTKNYSFSTHDSHSELYRSITLTKSYRRSRWGYFLRAESFYNVATAELDYAESSSSSGKYHQKSHGESFLSVIQDNIRPDGIYIFDEPEAALSPQKQLTLLIDIYKHAARGAQFIIATHSPILLGTPDAAIYSFDDEGVHPCSYEDTASYRVTELFINNRQRFLQQLLDD